jgi:hypothetical protein
MGKVNFNRTFKKTRLNRAREKRGSKYTFNNAIDGGRVFRGVNKKNSALGLNAVITEEEYRRECKEYDAGTLLP